MKPGRTRGAPLAPVHDVPGAVQLSAANRRSPRARLRLRAPLGHVAAAEFGEQAHGGLLNERILPYFGPTMFDGAAEDAPRWSLSPKYAWKRFSRSVSNSTRKSTALRSGEKSPVTAEPKTDRRRTPMRLHTPERQSAPLTGRPMVLGTLPNDVSTRPRAHAQERLVLPTDKLRRHGRPHPPLGGDGDAHGSRRRERGGEGGRRVGAMRSARLTGSGGTRSNVGACRCGAPGS